MNKNDLPLGFSMALAQNETAMNKFEHLSEEEKDNIIKQTHCISSKNEMHSFVNNLENMNNEI